MGEVTKSDRMITAAGLEDSAANLLPPGTVLVTSRASIGNCAIAGVPVTTNQGFASLVPHDRRSSRFLYFWIQLNRAELLRRAAGSTFLEISSQALANIGLAVPDLDAQAMIGAVLADADAAVTSLSQVILKKERVRKAWMHRLFHCGDGQQGEAKVPLGEVTSWFSGGTPNRAHPAYWSGTVPWISASTLRSLSVSTSDQKITPAAVRKSSRMAPLGSTLLLVRGSALHSEIRAALVTAPVCFNQDVKALIPRGGLVPKFLTYSIHANASRLLRLVSSAGNTAGVLETQLVKRFEIWLPKRSDQERIVGVLDDVENELTAYRLRLEKAKGLKQGMMQELLGGRTRLPVEELANA